MSGLAISMMILICGLVWGGFLILFSRALRAEKLKESSEVADER